MSLALHPDHLADLRKSTLTDTSIAAAHIHSVAPGDLQKKLGQSLFAKVEHAYSLPYHTIDGKVNGFERLKLFADPDHHLEMRYWQPPESHAHLYLPPGADWQKVAADCSVPLRVSEGEKKALCACQYGLDTAGIGGCWLFRITLDDGQRITLPELDQFVWKDRHVELIPDSDAWRKDKLFDILAGFFALAMELTSRGALVVFVRLPDIPGVAKTGLDDWFGREGAAWRESWPHLERITLDDPSLHPIIKWWQRWRERQATDEALRDQDHEALDLQETAGLYTVCSAKHHVKLTFDRLTEQRGGVTAELTITRGQTELLGATDISLKSDSSRDKIAKTLKGFMADVPWKRLLERACTVVLKRHREGEPIIVLAPAADVHVPFLLNPFLYHGHPSLFYAPGGSLKSYFGLYLALLASHGAHQQGLAAVQVPVLFLDWELNAATVGGRLTALRAGHPELTEYAPYYRRCERPLQHEAAAIARHVAEHGVELLILDSALMACGADLGKPETAEQLHRILRQIGCTSLLLAHVAKLTPEGQERSAFGSVFFRELARNVWELERADGDGPARIICTHTKYNFSAQHAPVAFEFTFTPEAVQVAACDPRDEPAFEEKLGLSARIRNLLEDGKLRTTEEIAKALGISTPKQLRSLRSTLSQGKKTRKWSLVTTPEGDRWTVLRG
jgi:hypothetical protein